MVTKKDCVAAAYYNSYISLPEEEDVLKAIKKNSGDIKKFLKTIPAKKYQYAYAPGKWTIKEVLQHVIDAERVFAYRALVFARKDPAALPSFDEKLWSQHANVQDRKWRDLVREIKAVRKSTEQLFGSFSDEQLLANGTASENRVNVVALGFICAGHAAHHLGVIEQKYM